MDAFLFVSLGYNEEKGNFCDKDKSLISLK